MVGWLVEEKDVGIGGEGAGEEGPALVAARECGKRLVAVELDALEDIFHLVLDRPAIGLVELVLELVEAVADCSVVGMLGDFM